MGEVVLGLLLLNYARVRVFVVFVLIWLFLFEISVIERSPAVLAELSN